VSDQVLHPYKTTGKIIFLYILISIFCNSKVLNILIVKHYSFSRFMNLKVLATFEIITAVLLIVQVFQVVIQFRSESGF
jgi:hypothetical protein